GAFSDTTGRIGLVLTGPKRIWLIVKNPSGNSHPNETELSQYRDCIVPVVECNQSGGCDG
ncbi:MAG: hypothetical protein KME36_10060, partial [Candidatus Thiodiazotropha sp. (ex Lucina pensylvanica)]|nr:hypothetical protein [Candidatus Thiodiazotropha sp. (ex Lucina pensylvanica)]